MPRSATLESATAPCYENFPASQQLRSTRSCEKSARNGISTATSTHSEPTHAIGRPRHTLQRCSAQAARFFAAAQALSVASSCGRRARKQHGDASTLQHSPPALRALTSPPRAPKGSAKSGLTHVCQRSGSQLMVEPKVD